MCICVILLFIENWNNRVVLWAAAAACVPAMQKGNDTARSIHIAANVSGMGLFAWQIITGWPILLKVTELTKWP